MEFLQQTWLWYLRQLSGGSLVVCLCTGAAFLVASALILAYSRIGQRRPVLTCVVLSVVAHLLLLVMASRVIFERPLFGTGDGETASISVIEIDDSEELPSGEPAVPVPDAESPQPQAWDLVQADEVIPAPRIDDLPRPDNEAELVLEREVPLLPDQPETQPWSAPPALPFPAGAQAEAELRAEAAPAPPLPEVAMPTLVHSEMVPPAPLEQTREADRLLVDAPPAFAPDIADLPPVDALETADAMERGRAVPDSPRPDFAQEPVAAVPPMAIPLPAPLVPDNNTQPLPDLRTQAAAVPLRPATDRPLPLEYSLRSAPRREEIVIRNGGSADTEAAVAAALRWLAATQEADGRWDPRRHGAGVEARVLGQDRQGAGDTADSGITALALLTFLSAGHTHLDGGEYAGCVQRGLDFLRRAQAADGSLAGQARLFERTYCHSMAMLAIGESAAMTGDESLRGTLSRAVQWTIMAQNRVDGGWRYQPGDPGDMSQFGWQVLGLKSAGLAGLSVPRETRDGMERFLHQCTLGQHRGLASYRPGERPTPTMTAEALLCRYLLEATPSDATIQEAAALVLRNPPRDSAADYYYWYYATMAMYQTGGNAWQQWNTALTPVLLSRQATEGPEAGSFAADNAWSTYGGRVFSTAMATLCLEVYYRYMPVYEALRQPAATPR